MFRKLSPADLERRRAAASFPEYVEFLGNLRKGQGGTVDVATSGATKQTVKNRLKRTADAVGVRIKFVRSPHDEVVFEVVGRA